MREYNVNYDVFAGNKLFYTGRRDACYANLLRTMVAGITKIKAYYWIEPPTTKEDANWFVENFIIPTIPKRLNGTFNVSFDPDDIKNAVEKTGKYWTTVSFDTKRISVFDLFTLLTLFRYPQEQPNFISHMKEHISEGMSTNDAFLWAHNSGSSQNWGHLLIGYKFYYASMGGVKVKIHTDIKTQWEKIHPTLYKQPYSEYTRLSPDATLHKIFDVVYS